MISAIINFNTTNVLLPLNFKTKKYVNRINRRYVTRFNCKRRKVVVQFSASWCGNCRIMKPNSKLASENETITFALVDAENFLNQEN
jgi:thiol-disulfide isomerase/thioredoxin